MMIESEGRERVLREARVLFLERGFAEVSMQQIADAAGMTKASLYYHFKDKEDLFANVVQHEAKRLMGGIAAELDGIESLPEQLKRIVLYCFDSVRSDIGRLMTDFQRHVSEESHRRLRETFEGGDIDPIAWLRPYFQRAAAAGQLREIDVDFAIVLFFGMLGGTFKFAEHQKCPLPFDAKQAETMVDVFLNGVLARPVDEG